MDNNNQKLTADQYLAKGRAILDEHKGKDLSEEQILEVKSLFDSAEKAQLSEDNASLRKALEERASTLASNKAAPIARMPMASVEDVAAPMEAKSLPADQLCAKAKRKGEANLNKDESAQYAKFMDDSLTSYIMGGNYALDNMAQKALSSNRDTDGGIFVHGALENALIKALDDELEMRNLVTVVPVAKASGVFPTFEFVGTVDEVAEGATITEQTITNVFGKQEFNIHKKAVLFKIPEELEADADRSILNLMVNHFAKRAAEQVEDDIINGDGNNEALGLLQANLTAVDLAASATSIKAIDVLSAPGNLARQYRRNGRYIMSRTEFSNLNQLLDTTGRPIFRQSDNLTAGVPALLNGYPVHEVERMTAPAADGDCSFIFGDLKTYYLMERQGVAIKRLDELYAAEGKIGIRITLRYDGSPTDQDALIRVNRN